MPAYMIVIAKIADRDAFIHGYGAAAARLVTQFGGTYVLRGPGAEVLEGQSGGMDWHGASMVISEWPDKAAAHAFWFIPPAFVTIFNCGWAFSVGTSRASTSMKSVA